MVLEAERVETGQSWVPPLGALLWGTQLERLWFLVVQTETETVWPGKLSEDQTAISLF